MQNKNGIGWGGAVLDIVCLEHGEACSVGTICPIFDVPSEEMKEKVEEYRRTAEGG